MKITKINFALAAIIFLGSILRLYKLTAVSLWHDESFSALLIRYPYKEMIDRIILDVHPPLYYMLLRIWDFMLGDSLFSLRLFSVFFGILTVYFTYLFIKNAFKSEKLGLISAAFIALNPFQIQYSSEARMYTLGTFLAVLSSWLLVKALESLKNSNELNLEQNNNKFINNNTEPSGKNKKNIFDSIKEKIKKYQWWILYGVSAALAYYTHYYLLFSIAAQGLFVILWGYKNYSLKAKEWLKSANIRGAFIGYTVSIVLFLPWIPVLLKQLGQVEENYWIPKMNMYSILNTIFKIFSGTNINTGNTELILFTIIFIAIFVFALKREKNDYKCLIALSFILPFVLAIGLSYKRSLYLDRYFVFTGLFYFMILALFLEQITKNILKKALLAFLLIASVLFFIRGWQNTSPAGKPGVKDAAEYIFKNAEPNEKVFVASTFIFFAYKYYAYQNLFYDKGYPADFNPSALKPENNIIEGYRLFPEYYTPLLYTPGITSVNQLPHFSGTALLTTDDLLNDFNSKVRSGDKVWILWTTGFGSGKPEVPKNWQQIDEAGFQDVFGYRGWIVATKYSVQ